MTLFFRPGVYFNVCVSCIIFRLHDVHFLTGRLLAFVFRGMLYERCQTCRFAIIVTSGAFCANSDCVFQKLEWKVDFKNPNDL